MPGRPVRNASRQAASASPGRHHALSFQSMPYILAGFALLVVWGVATALTPAPGWIHLLLTVGVALCVYGIVKRKVSGKK